MKWNAEYTSCSYFFFLLEELQLLPTIYFDFLNFCFSFYDSSFVLYSTRYTPDHISSVICKGGLVTRRCRMTQMSKSIHEEKCVQRDQVVSIIRRSLDINQCEWRFPSISRPETFNLIKTVHCRGKHPSDVNRMGFCSMDVKYIGLSLITMTSESLALRTSGCTYSLVHRKIAKT